MADALADVIPFPSPRRAAPSTIPCPPPEVARLPLIVQAAPGAVALELPDTEFWLTAGQARELAADLLAAADSSEASRG